MREVIKKLLISIMDIILIMLMPFFLLLENLKIVINILSNIYFRYLESKKYSEKKVKRKLYAQIKQILSTEKEIYLCKEFWISPEKYKYYTTLKYLFTKNKSSFVYRKDSSRYLYNYYNFNAHKEDFLDKWIQIIKSWNDKDIIIEEIVLKNSSEDDDGKSVLKITYSMGI